MKTVWGKWNEKIVPRQNPSEMAKLNLPRLMLINNVNRNRDEYEFYFSYVWKSPFL